MINIFRIIDTRGSGKTSRLMLLAKENKGTIVCSNPSAMRQKAFAYGITGINFVSYTDFINGVADEVENYYIDELEVFIKWLANMTYTNTKFEGYTLSEDED